MERLGRILITVGLILAIALLSTNLASGAGTPVVTPGNDPTFFGVGGVKYRAFQTHPTQKEIFLGVPDLALGPPNRTDVDLTWSSPNSMTLVYDKANDRLTTTVTNSSGTSWTLHYPNFSTNVTNLKFGGDASQAAEFLAGLDTLQIIVTVKFGASAALSLANVSLDGNPLGTFNGASGVSTYWMVTGYDLSNGFTLTGQIIFSGNHADPETSRIEVYLGQSDDQGPISSNVTPAPQEITPGGTVNLSADVDDSTTGNSAIQSAEYNLDSGAWTAMSASDGAFDEVNENVTAAFSAPVALGTHSVCVRGTDIGSNTGNQTCATLIVDNQGPVTSSVAAVPNPVTTGGAVTLTADVDDSTTGGSHIQSAEYSFDGGAWTAMSAGDGAFDEVTEDVTAGFNAPGTPGHYTVCVRGTDGAGLTGSQSCTSLHVDDQGPAASGASASPNPVGPGGSVSLSANVNDSGSGGANIAGAQYNLDGGPWNPMTASDGAFDEPIEDVSTSFLANLSPGSHTICVRGLDAAGNPGEPTCFTLVVDDQGPAVSGVSAAPNPAQPSQAITLSASLDDSGSGGSAIASAEYSLDGGPWNPMTASDGAFDEVTEDVTATFNAPGTSGVYTLCVRGTDNLGNTGGETCTTLHTDDQGPAATNLDAEPSPAQPGAAIVLTAMLDDTATGGSNVASAEYKLDGGPWAAMSAQDGAYDESSEAVQASFNAPATTGAHTLCVRGADSAGNVGIQACITLNVDNQGPLTSNLAAAPNPAGTGGIVTLTATVDDTTTGGSKIQSAEYRVDGGAWTAMSAQDGAFDEVNEAVTGTLTAPATPGAHTLCARGMDAAGVTGTENCTALTTDSLGPVTSNLLATPNRVAPGAAIALSARVDDATTGGSKIKSASYNVDNGTWKPMSAQDGAFDEVAEEVIANLTAPSGQGTHTLCARGTDVAGKTGAKQCVQVFVDGQGPYASDLAAAPNPVEAGSQVTLTAQIDDTATGKSILQSAQYRLAGGTWKAMNAQDGAFDEVAEGVRARLPTPGIAGNYQVCVRGVDRLGNMGAQACIQLTVNGPPADGDFVVLPIVLSGFGGH